MVISLLAWAEKGGEAHDLIEFKGLNRIMISEPEDKWEQVPSLLLLFGGEGEGRWSEINDAVMIIYFTPPLT